MAASDSSDAGAAELTPDADEHRESTSDQPDKRPPWWPFGSGDSQLEIEFEQLKRQLSERSDILDHAMMRVHSSIKDPRLRRRVASTDLFVERAQAILLRRSERMFHFGQAATVSALLAFLMALAFSYLVLRSEPGDLSNQALALRAVQALAFGGFMLFGLRYLVSLARSFFQESISLMDRRHALRFGRLYVHLDSTSKDPTDMELRDLIEAFQWNLTVESSFLDIDPSSGLSVPGPLASRRRNGEKRPSQIAEGSSAEAIEPQRYPG